MRFGQVKKRLWPWFDPPPPGPTVRYHGWAWDPAIGEWIQIEKEPLEFVVDSPRYPMPSASPRPFVPDKLPGWRWDDVLHEWVERSLTTMEAKTGIVRGPKPLYSPGPQGAHDVKGWSWDGTTGRWVATIVFAQRIKLDVPTSFAPNITLEAVNMMVPSSEQYQIALASLQARGFSLSEARRVIDPLVDGFWKMSRSNAQTIRAAAYAESFRAINVAMQDKIEKIGVYAAMILIAAVVGLLIGNITERLTFIEDDSFMLVDSEGTYLLGPGNWQYSKNIGKSVQGNNFYSDCQDIGTEYVRHKRAFASGDSDTIDFPGGFVETGYKFPYWVKYRWSYWRLQYIGMLIRRQDSFYELKRADHDPFISRPVGTRLPTSAWCSNLHYYL